MSQMLQQPQLFSMEFDPIQKILFSLKESHDSLRKKIFAEIDLLKKEVEFLSLQIQLIDEQNKKDN